jgi:hypothetical protein
MSTKFLPTEHVKENILYHNKVTSLLITMLSTSKLKFFFVKAINSNATF